MSSFEIFLIITVSLLGLMAMGLPVAFCLLGVAIAGYIVFVGPAALFTIVPVAFDALTKELYIAIPLFVLMAVVLDFSGVAVGLYDAIHKWVGSVRGGLAMATVVASTIMAAMTGLVATAILTLGLVAYPQMISRGYDKKLSIGAILLGGLLGPIIPPSLPMIFVAGMTGLSVGRLFMAGVVPGLLCAIAGIIYIGIRCRLNPNLGPPIPPSERPKWKEKFVALWKVIPAVILIVLVLGGIWGGIFTPTEASGIGAFGALICAAINRTLNWKNLRLAVMMTMKFTGLVMLLAIGGQAFSSLTGITGVNKFVHDAVTGLSVGAHPTVIIMVVILLIMGMFVEVLAILFITLPIMFPIAVGLGFDPLWFGFIYIFAVLIGNLTPPFGYAMFYFKGLGHEDVTMQDIYAGAIPYVGVVFAVLALSYAFPELVLWIPRMMS